MIYKYQNKAFKLESEIKIHRALKNDNIVNFEHVFKDSESVYILIEMCSN